MPSISLDRSEPASGIYRCKLGQFAERQIDDACASREQYSAGIGKRGGHLRFQRIEHIGLSRGASAEIAGGDQLCRWIGVEQGYRLVKAIGGAVFETLWLS